MTQALEPSAYIFEGIWTNHSKTGVRGLTLTLTSAHSTLLTNSLALFVTLAGGQLQRSQLSSFFCRAFFNKKARD